MQLIWLSGPTANVVTISITRKTIVTAVVALTIFLVMLGGVLQLLGIRIAVDAHPSLARTLGGITSSSEQQRIGQQYEQQIAALQQKVSGLVDQVNELESTKKSIVQLIPTLNNHERRFGGQGGPLNRILDIDGWFAPKAVDGLKQVNLQSNDLDHRIRTLTAVWKAEIDVVQGLPLRVPLSVDHHLTSGFGIRIDPFSRGLGRHEGIDYVAPHGSPIVATAGGVVVVAEASGAYGLAVDIDHGRGFSTRYAHLSKLDVQKGEQVSAGQVIGRLGNTGRSTGAHLHYEIRVFGQAIDPTTSSVLQAARSQLKSTKVAVATQD
jgi:murein DD-endopeptidase MepM/ murein hydrolase activator NlpD